MIQPGAVSTERLQAKQLTELRAAHRLHVEAGLNHSVDGDSPASVNGIGDVSRHLGQRAAPMNHETWRNEVWVNERKTDLLSRPVKHPQERQDFQISLVVVIQQEPGVDVPDADRLWVLAGVLVGGLAFGDAIDALCP